MEVGIESRGAVERERETDGRMYGSQTEDAMTLLSVLISLF